MYIQNQRGPGKAGKLWDRSGVVLEDKGFDKYAVKVDGSGRITDRNRRFLRAFKSEHEPSIPGPRPTIAGDSTHGSAQERISHDDVPISEEYPGIPADDPTEQAPNIVRAAREIVAPPPPSTVQTSPASSPMPVSRSQRVRKPNSLLDPETWDLSTV